MKIKKLLILLGCTLAMQTSYANLTVHPFTKLSTDFCKSLTGEWKGGGDVIASYITCTYEGTSIVVPGYALTTPLNISMDMYLKDGPEVCPPHATLDLPATCDNNALTVNTDNADMSGSVDSTGTVVNMQGTVFFDVGGRRVEADIKNVHLVKQ
jgi:hypothetical protein